MARLARQCGRARRFRSVSPLNDDQIPDQHLADAPRPACAATDQGHTRGPWGDWVQLPITDVRAEKRAAAASSRRRARISLSIRLFSKLYLVSDFFTTHITEGLEHGGG